VFQDGTGLQLKGTFSRGFGMKVPFLGFFKPQKNSSAHVNIMTINLIKSQNIFIKNSQIIT
jgi:hypothetical protein